MERLTLTIPDLAGRILHMALNFKIFLIISSIALVEERHRLVVRKIIDDHYKK